MRVSAAKSKVLRPDLKDENDGLYLTEKGREFQVLMAEQEKVRCLVYRVLVSFGINDLY